MQKSSRLRMEYLIKWYEDELREDVNRLGFGHLREQTTCDQGLYATEGRVPLLRDGCAENVLDVGIREVESIKKIRQQFERGKIVLLVVSMQKSDGGPEHLREEDELLSRLGSDERLERD